MLNIRIIRTVFIFSLLASLKTREPYNWNLSKITIYITSWISFISPPYKCDLLLVNRPGEQQTQGRQSSTISCKLKFYKKKNMKSSTASWSEMRQQFYSCVLTTVKVNYSALMWNIHIPCVKLVKFNIDGLWHHIGGDLQPQHLVKRTNHNTW